MFGHLDKHCRNKDKPNCAFCSDKHKTSDCQQPSTAKPTCFHCKKQGHEATSQQCEIYKEQQKRMRNNVERYSAGQKLNVQQQQPLSTWIDDENEFPSLSQNDQLSTTNQMKYIETLAEIFFTKMEKRFENLVKQLKKELRSTNSKEELIDPDSKQTVEEPIAYMSDGNKNEELEEDDNEEEEKPEIKTTTTQSELFDVTAKKTTSTEPFSHSVERSALKEIAYISTQNFSPHNHRITLSNKISQHSPDGRKQSKIKTNYQRSVRNEFGSY
ncbi:unnamed protein product [Didymodactylos carnosus]|uniref:Uncharacterized protein n=1 Tax=Didymodactylos carnosus TaxID=1234261 RepID=A0A814ZFT0_9BILA|nr:unnamed protein product [Didymodactylos carnosus]CAF1469433.1 unnamed protein product [Didymodactylos carnosus]CAF4004253.1 unnamed protein product [Didymodactylos carnosus]CAF4261529.1 unnamed protein product [Didymodactylos carnosus]